MIISRTFERFGFWLRNTYASFIIGERKRFTIAVDEEPDQRCEELDTDLARQDTLVRTKANHRL
jgi:hypothetical protein